MSRSAFIVKDHKTFMNAEEARFRFACERSDAVLFVIIPVGDPNNVVPSLKVSVKKGQWNEIVWIKTLSNYNPREFKKFKKRHRLLDSIMQFLEYLFNMVDVLRINRIANRYKQDIFSHLFTVHRNMHEHLAARLQPEKAFLLDSGQTLDKIESNGYIDYRRREYGTRFRRVMLRLSRLQMIDRRRMSLFTVYADVAETKHPLVRNNQDYKRHLIQNKGIGHDILFISSPFYQFTKHIKLETYIDYLTKVIRDFKIAAENFVYVPNPVRETSENIEMIVRALGCRCDDRLLTVEAKITEREYLPKACVTPSSTAIVNVSLLTENKIPCYAAWHPEFDSFEFLADWKRDIENDSDIHVDFVYIKDSPPFFRLNADEYRERPLYKNFNDWEQKKQTEKKSVHARIPTK